MKASTKPGQLQIDSKAFQPWKDADLFTHDEYKRRLTLTGGGVYDNLGLETLEKRCKTLLVSDAGAPFRAEPSPSGIWHTQALRAMDIATAQSRGLRKRRLITDYETRLRQGAYWGIRTEIEGYGLPTALPVSLEATRYLACLHTRLNPFSEADNSVLLRLVGGAVRVLLTGDCEARCEREVSRTSDVSADILNVGHHGSNAASSAAFLQKVKPRIAVIQAGARNQLNLEFCFAAA